MKIDFDESCGHIEFENPTKMASTYGGICWIDDYKIDDWGIQFDELSIGGLKAENMVDLGTAIISHLMTNGYRFEMIDTQDGGELKLKNAPL